MPNPYKGLLTSWRHPSEKGESSRRSSTEQASQPDLNNDADTTGTPSSISSPQTIPNPNQSLLSLPSLGNFDPSDDDIYTSMSPNTVAPFPPSTDGSGTAAGSSTGPFSTSIQRQVPTQISHWENVSSSSASIASSKPSTISTVQSSMFSRNAPTFGTVSSYGSSAASGFGRKGGLEFSAAIAEEGSLSTSSEGRNVMRVVDPDEMNSLVDDVNSLRTRGSNFGPHSSSPHQPRTAVIPTRSLLPDVSTSNVSTSALSDHSYWPERGSSVSSSWSSAGAAGGSGGSGGGSFGRPNVRRPLTAQDELKDLADSLTQLMEQTMSRTIDVSRAAVSVNQLLRQTLTSPLLENIPENEITLHSTPSLTRIIKVSFNFTDNLLLSPVFQPIKMFILRALHSLGVHLKLVPPVIGTVPHPKNFAIGSIPELPGQNTVEALINAVAANDSNGISEQDGAFIAPILRGFSPDFSVLSLSFGFPQREQHHVDNTAALYDISRDIHFYSQKSSIRVCSDVATASTSTQVPGSFNTTPHQSAHFIPPYRVPVNSKSPPISISLATETATNLSGTLGGYVYPKIDPSDPNLAEYAKSTFAITCAHVCLSESRGSPHPFVSVPSPVLVNIYKSALVRERNKYPANSQEHQEYEVAINQLTSKTTEKPHEPFGQVVWGERTVVNGSISDIAIIKCSPKMKCRNFLGDDISFAQYDPGLMFGNLHIKRIIRKLHPGMNVFKYGSTSKYTTGKLNGTRMVYWADGKLQSSEFVVCSESPVFASGGDSGAWVLQKSEDMQDDDDTYSGSDHDSTLTSRSTGGPCLGVLGMLHSYDGERKEFGLFTPIESILNRLHEVTHIKWGVVGVPDSESEDLLIGGSESSDSGDDVSDTDPVSVV
ncbi:Ssy5p [Sugiyamaella lignohabitans]|uniref:Ssy5p n=1 Tax=Sugiyamaella lignohabitans TaxID=796027 RepID=A0A161HHW9_9ASCO|nr:Ssy5p [Sugiyamaella lignohabitans]ANB15720.1 Ssy5p [Sugiyamaella lignohabitans]